MVAAAVWFVLGLVLLALGGDSIVKAASGLAQRFGASPFMAGLLLVAFGTSLPELVVNVRAFAVGAEELALGNAVGSNIVNIGLTLGLAALAAPLLVRARLLSPLLVLLAVAGLALIVFGLDGVIARWEGGVLLLGFVGVLVFLLRASRRETEPVREAIAGYAMTRTGLLLNGLRVLFAGVALYYGARWIVDAAPVLGAGLGWSPLLVGLLPVAIGTALPEVAAAIAAARRWQGDMVLGHVIGSSLFNLLVGLLPVAIGTALPEVAAAIAAARRGQGDMVLGHVIGSSLFNLLVVVGGMAALRPIALPESFVKLELPAAIAFVLVLYPMLRGDLTVSRREGGILLVAFVGWVALELALIGG